MGAIPFSGELTERDFSSPVRINSRLPMMIWYALRDGPFYVVFAAVYPVLIFRQVGFAQASLRFAEILAGLAFAFFLLQLYIRWSSSAEMKNAWRKQCEGHRITGRIETDRITQDLDGKSQTYLFTGFQGYGRDSNVIVLHDHCKEWRVSSRIILARHLFATESDWNECVTRIASQVPLSVDPEFKVGLIDVFTG